MANDHPVRVWRTKNGKTLESLAASVGCWASHLSEIENGKNNPSLALAAKLSKETGIPIDEFVRQGEGAKCA